MTKTPSGVTITQQFQNKSTPAKYGSLLYIYYQSFVLKVVQNFRYIHTVTTFQS